MEQAEISADIIKNSYFTLILLNTGCSINEADKITGNTDLFIEKDNFILIPVDVAMFGSSFMDAWKEGVARYKEYKNMEEKGELFSVKEYRINIKEASSLYLSQVLTLPPTDWQPNIPKKTEIENVLQADLKKYKKDKESSLISKYKNKLKVIPDDLKTRMALAEVYKENGFLNEAAEEYKQVLLVDDKNMTALYTLSDYALYNKKNEEAMSYLNKILEIYPAESRAIFDIAENYYLQDKYEEALEYYKKYLKLDTNDLNKKGTAQLKIGLCFAALKKLDRAVTELEKFINEYPQHDMVKDTKKTLEILKSSQ
ncbi:tetratricopeptide repeat protein [Candidatus Desantisbacteria bacterium]|nr:tetratricopeptide repeat protein [Candidatus Desantisbacteria bacterium]